MENFGQPHVIIISVLFIEVIFHFLFNAKLKKDENAWCRKIEKLTLQLKEAENQIKILEGEKE